MKLRLLAFFLLSSVALALGGARADDAETVSRSSQEEILDDIVRIMRTEMYDEQVAETYIEAVREYKQSDKFGTQASSDEFALSVHRALHRVKVDYHLSIFAPTRASAGADDAHGSDDSHDEHGNEAKEVPAANNFIQVIIEENGIRLIRFDLFEASDSAIERMYAVFKEVEDATGLIFDLRGNLGGNAKLARLMFGCLFKEATTLYSINIPRGEHARLSLYESEPVSRCARVHDKPIAVLVDHNTASTAELFPFILQNRHKAVIIGEATLGGAHAAESFQLAHGFRMVLPIGYVRDQVTGEDWETSGVTPDILVKPVDARMRAVEAIQQLIRCQKALAQAGDVLKGFGRMTSIRKAE